jgi:hypothetical protein
VVVAEVVEDITDVVGGVFKDISEVGAVVV